MSMMAPNEWRVVSVLLSLSHLMLPPCTTTPVTPAQPGHDTPTVDLSQLHILQSLASKHGPTGLNVKDVNDITSFVKDITETAGKLGSTNALDVFDMDKLNKALDRVPSKTQGDVADVPGGLGGGIVSLGLADDHHRGGGGGAGDLWQDSTVTIALVGVTMLLFLAAVYCVLFWEDLTTAVSTCTGVV